MTQSQDYREIKAVSNSLMGVYEDDFDTFTNYWVRNIPLPQKRHESLTMGSIIDTLLTTPDEFLKRFITFPGTVPTGQLLQFLTICAKNHTDGPVPDVVYEAAYTEVGFKRDSLAKVIDRAADHKEYFNFLIESRGKEVLSVEQVSKANMIVNELINGKFTGPVVNVKSVKTDTKHIDVINQLEITAEYVQEIDGRDIVVPIKGALDRVIVDHINKIIIGIDFKSSFQVNTFKDSYEKWRYYRQGSFYLFLLETWAAAMGYSDYTIKPFLFVVCSTTGGKHFMYRMTKRDIEMARIGGHLYSGQHVKGWDQILQEICYLTHVGDWSYPYEAVINDGMVPLNIFRYD